VVLPVYPIPPHCPYLATAAPPFPGLEVADGVETEVDLVDEATGADG